MRRPLDAVDRDMVAKLERAFAHAKHSWLACQEENGCTIVTESLRTVTDNEPEAAFTRLNAKRTFEEVVTRIREMLFGGALKPGDRLPGERDLAAQLGIGRPAVREALRALESSGLITLRKGKTGGAFISKGKASVIAENMADMLRLSSISVDQFYELRL